MKNVWAILSLLPWFYRHGNVTYKLPIIENIIKELREKEKIEKIGIIGNFFFYILYNIYKKVIVMEEKLLLLLLHLKIK